MRNTLDGNAIVYCEGAYQTPNGKTAHGLVRFTERYHILSVIDSHAAGNDALEILDGKKSSVPVVATLEAALKHAANGHKPATHFVIGLAPDGGKLSDSALAAVKEALSAKLHVDCGLHDFLSERKDLVDLAEKNGCQLRDIRKPPARSELHFFSGRIEKVKALKVAVLGTDSAVGKRTTAWMIVHSLRHQGIKAELIGTGQTAWLQGARYSLVIDSLVNDFISGEIEHQVVSADTIEKPQVIVIEGQGSLMNPAYPGGYEILAAARPDLVILQHAPKRLEYDGFPGYPLHPLAHQIHAIEVVSGKKVAAITLNHEKMKADEVEGACERILREVGIPAFDVLLHGASQLTALIQKHLR
jgi:uncharacterized NAD-dependent epimerase/dehydratase family protein